MKKLLLMTTALFFLTTQSKSVYLGLTSVEGCTTTINSDNTQTDTCTYSRGMTSVTNYTLDGTILSESYTDSEGFTEKTTYGQNGQKTIEYTEPGIGTTTEVFNSANKLISQTTIYGVKTEYRYYDSGEKQEVKTTYPYGMVTTVTYAENGKDITSEETVYYGGSMTRNEYAYDGNGNRHTILVVSEGPLNFVTSFYYDTSWNLARTVEIGPGYATTTYYQYNDTGIVKRKDVRYENTGCYQSTRYDDYGNQIYYNAYDGSGNVEITITNPTYDDNGKFVSYTKSYNYHDTTWTVDCDSSCPYNKVVYSSSKIDSDNGTRTQTIYHANGILVTTVTDLSTGQVTSKTSKNIDTGVEDSTKYTGNTDYYGNATYYTVSKSMNGTTTITDVGENQSSLILTYPSGDTEVDRHIPVDANTPVQNYTKEINRMIFDSETYTVDEYKNIIEYHDIYSQGREILKKYTYEGETYKGYTVKTITENGSGTLEVFDATNTLVSSTVINYDGSYGRVTEYSVDDKGYKTETVTTKGYENETYVYETTYDTNGKKIRSSTSISSADGSTTVTDYTYDSNGKLTSSTSTQNGQTTTTKYNPGTYKPTQTTTTNSDGTTTVTDYTYDSNGNKTATTATTFDANEKETSTVKTTYDAKSGHVLTEDGKTSDGYTYNKEYKKDSHGNWVGTGSDSFSQSYTYDDNGNTTQYKVVDFDGTVKEERNYTYEDGKLVSSDYAYSSGDSGSSTTTYNPDGSYTTTRERNSANGTYYAEIVNYDSSKNPTSAQTTTTADGKTKTYDYDSSGRVTGYTETYSDKHGNQYKNTYDRSGQLLSSTSDLLRIYTLPEAYAITTKNSSNSFLIRYR